MVPFVTEVFIREGLVSATTEGDFAAQIDVSLVDNLGGLSEGRLRRGENPVLVTFELLIEPVEFAKAQ
ncbi:hypothetical protein DIE06_36545 [Burkholderia sp. Bp8998]|nr:hypothetical protein DIE06_36545 [Burkholderia sp. Bp8998]